MNRPPPRRDTRIEKTLAYHLLVATNRIAQPFAERYGKQFGLTLPEWRCMMALAPHPDSSGEDVARRMGMDKMGVSRSLRRLEKDGRATRQPDPDNAKRNLWRLTDDGWAVFDFILPHALDRDREAFKNISDDERERFIKALRSFDS